MLLSDLLHALGARGIRLRLSSLGTPETRAEYREELTAYLRAHAGRALAGRASTRIELNPMRAFDSGDERTRAMMRDAPLLLDRLADDDAEHFARVRELLDDAGIAYELDPTLVRGLDYYTRTVFEFTSDALGAQSGVGGGGRYDGLIEQLGGRPTPGVGWAAGVERILLSATELPVAADGCDLFVAVADAPTPSRAAFDIAREARRAGLSAQLELAGRSLKGQLKHADRLGARYVAIVSDDERASLRNMESGDQNEIERGAVVAAVLRGDRL